MLETLRDFLVRQMRHINKMFESTRCNGNRDYWKAYCEGYSDAIKAFNDKINWLDKKVTNN